MFRVIAGDVVLSVRCSLASRCAGEGEEVIIHGRCVARSRGACARGTVRMATLFNVQYFNQPVSDAPGRAVNGLCGRKRQVRSRSELCQGKSVTVRAKPWVSRDAVLRGCHNDRTSLSFLSTASSSPNTHHIRVSTTQRPVPADERAWHMRTSLHRYNTRKYAGLCFSSTCPIPTHTINAVFSSEHPSKI